MWRRYRQRHRLRRKQLFRPKQEERLMRRNAMKGTGGSPWIGPRRRLVWWALWLQRRPRRLRLVSDSPLLTESGDVLTTENGEELRKEENE